MRTIAKLALLAMALGLTRLGLADESGALELPFDIPAQTLTEALDQLSEQARVQVLHRASASGEEPKTQSVKGTLSLRQALERLLTQTGYRYELINERTVRVAKAEEDAKKSPGTMEKVDGRDSTQTPDPGAGKDYSPPSDKQNNESTSSGARDDIAEIVVTAQKREERLQDVPVPVTVISASSLISGNQVRLQDYYARIPGLNLTTGGYDGNAKISIRGLVTPNHAGAPTVGIVIDDIPFGASWGQSSGFSGAPDIDPSNLAQVEVLRGPQGTLYGTSTLGGLLKLVTTDPSVDGLSGRVQVGTSSVRNGDGLGYNVRGAINVPLSSTWAIRASGFTRRDAGYIDDPVLGLDGVNRVDVRGGRLAALWKPSGNLSLKLSALIQDDEADNVSAVDRLPGLEDLQHVQAPGAGFYRKDLQAFSAILRAKFGGVDLTASSGYNISGSDSSTSYFGLVLNHQKTRKFTQEVRASIPLGERFEWMVGAFYTREKAKPLHQEWWTTDPVTGDLTDPLAFYDVKEPFTETAAFTNLTWKLTDRFDVQIGSRQSKLKLSAVTTTTVPEANLFYPQAGVFVDPTLKTDSTPFTYLLAPRFKVSPDQMIYARLASGFRTGAANAYTDLSRGPASYGPDKTESYEIGVKGTWHDRLLTYDASLYYIDWKDIQLYLFNPGAVSGYLDNAGRAKSQGLELSIELTPASGLTIAAWGAWNEAELTEPFPPGSRAFGRRGDRLPYSSRLSGSLSLDQEFPLAGGMTGFVGGSMSYVDDRAGSFKTGAQSPRPIFPGYTQVDLRAGIRKDSWTVDTFVTNVTDERGILSGDPSLSSRFFYIRPRTVGLSLTKSF